MITVFLAHMIDIFLADSEPSVNVSCSSVETELVELQFKKLEFCNLYCYHTDFFPPAFRTMVKQKHYLVTM